MADGIIIIDKPQDWTSMDVCAKLRRVFGEKRVGHGGTLDPLATGVLPVFVGRATRAVEFAEKGSKEYIATLHLGMTTDTQDVTGTVLEEKPVSVHEGDVKAVLPRFTGDIQQIPPMYSALKVNGQKLYDLARKGKTVERKPRDITIYELELVERLSDTDYLLRIRCSKGTYIRTLCHDIGQALGCGGTMSSLRRTRVGPFREGVTMEQVQKAADEQCAAEMLAPVDGCFAHCPAITASERECVKFIRNGTPYPCAEQEGEYRVYSPEGEFMMLGRVENGQMTTVKSFFEV